MVTRDELTATIENLLGIDLLDQARRLDPYANGVQIQGVDQVSKIALGVSATLDFLHEATNAHAQYTLTHHGLDLSPHNIVASRLHPGIQSQLAYAFSHQLTVAGFHYSLDVHETLGNNAVIIRELGAKRTNITYGDGWGWVGEFDQPQNIKTLANKCAKLFDHDIFAVYAGPELIKRIGVCSGGDKPYDTELWEIIDKHIDLHISGEIVEPGTELAKGIGFNYFSAGHYATEIFGVQELGKKLKEHYKDKLDVEFIDIPNPL